MKSLDQFNAERRAAWDIAANPQSVYNDLACPKCTHELMDTSPEIFDAYPPRKIVRCPKCGFKSYRIA